MAKDDDVEVVLKLPPELVAHIRLADKPDVPLANVILGMCEIALKITLWLQAHEGQLNAAKQGKEVPLATLSRLLDAATKGKTN